MTEDEWLACERPDSMLKQLSSIAPEEALVRRRRLFICACCRLIWERLTAPVESDAVEVAERFADGGCSDVDLDSAREACHSHGRTLSDRIQYPRPATRATCRQHRLESYALEEAMATVRVRGETACDRARPQTVGHRLGPVVRKAYFDAERRVLCQLIRDIFSGIAYGERGNPAQAVPGVASIAQAAYEERHLPSGHLDLTRLAVLSDALLDAGYRDDAILSHFRSPGPHVRGCWALDLVLGKQ